MLRDDTCLLSYNSWTAASQAPRTSIRHWQTAEIFVKPYVRVPLHVRTIRQKIRVGVCVCVARSSSMNAHVYARAICGTTAKRERCVVRFNARYKPRVYRVIYLHLSRPSLAALPENLSRRGVRRRLPSRRPRINE